MPLKTLANEAESKGFQPPGVDQKVKLRRGLPFVVELPGDSDILLPASSRQAALDSCYDD